MKSKRIHPREKVLMGDYGKNPVALLIMKLRRLREELAYNQKRIDQMNIVYADEPGVISWNKTFMFPKERDVLEYELTIVKLFKTRHK